MSVEYQTIHAIQESYQLQVHYSEEKKKAKKTVAMRAVQFSEQTLVEVSNISVQTQVIKGLYTYGNMESHMATL